MRRSPTRATTALWSAQSSTLPTTTTTPPTDGDTTTRRSNMTDVRNVVLVHGGFVDGSGWHAVYDLLTADGFRVSVVQNQTISLEGDVAATRQVLDQQN